MEWIKVEKATARKAEVLRIATLMKIHPDHAVGLCIRFWCWCDDNMASSGKLDIDSSVLDAVLGSPGFSQALLTVDWLQVRSGSLVVPRSDRHLSQTAKTRALAAERQSKSRKAKQDKKPKQLRLSQQNVTDVTKIYDQRREEEIREESNHTPHRAGDPGGEPGPRDTFLTGPSDTFQAFLAAYPRKTAPAKAWLVWQSVVAGLVGTRGWTDGQAERWLLERAEVYATSPSGLPPPPGQTDDFRPAPARWLEDGKYDEPTTEWMKPNLKGDGHGYGNKSSRSARGAAKQTAAAAAVAVTEDLDSFFESVVTGRVGASATEGLPAAAGVRGQP